VTGLLTAAAGGDSKAIEKLTVLVYTELRRLASHYLRGERPDHTLQPTALVHEAYIQLVDQKEMHWLNRAHFVGVAAHLMRRILVDHARAHHAAKRGGHRVKVSLDEAFVASPDRSNELLEIEDSVAPGTGACLRKIGMITSASEQAVEGQPRFARRGRVR
jgi:RNA polymerase sigma-70 factor (ECF subfamily)